MRKRNFSLVIFTLLHTAWVLVRNPGSNHGIWWILIIRTCIASNTACSFEKTLFSKLSIQAGINLKITNIWNWQGNPSSSRSLELASSAVITNMVPCIELTIIKHKDIRWHLSHVSRILWATYTDILLTYHVSSVQHTYVNRNWSNCYTKNHHCIINWSFRKVYEKVTDIVLLYQQTSWKQGTVATCPIHVESNTVD